MMGASFVAFVVGVVLLVGVLSGMLPPTWGHLAAILILGARIEARLPHA